MSSFKDEFKGLYLCEQFADDEGLYYEVEDIQKHCIDRKKVLDVLNRNWRIGIDFKPDEKNLISIKPIIDMIKRELGLKEVEKHDR